MKKLLFVVLSLLLSTNASAQQVLAALTPDATITADADFVEYILPANTETLTVTLTGTFVSANRVDVTAFNDATRWTAGRFVSAAPLVNAADNTGAVTMDAAGSWVIGNVGWQRIRIYGTDWTSGTVTVTVVVGHGGVSLGGGGGGGGGGTVSISQIGTANDVNVVGPVDVLFSGQALVLYATGDVTVPFAVPQVSVNSDGSIADFGTVNYHNAAPLVNQDGPVILCKSWPGAPTALSFNTNLTMVNCNPEGKIRTISSSLVKFRSIDLDESEEEADADGGELCSVWVTNTATTTRWLKIYNATAATVVVGTTVPDLTIGIPGNTTDDITGSFNTGNGCWAYATALSLAATTGVLDNDTGAPGANDVIVDAFIR